MPDHIIDYVTKRGIHQKKVTSLEEVLPETDVLYMTRIQNERFASQEEYKEVLFFISISNFLPFFQKLGIVFILLFLPGLWSLRSYAPAHDTCQKENGGHASSPKSLRD